MAAGDFSATIRQILFQPGYKVYAVLDGASVKGLLDKLFECKPEHICLYRGELAPDMAHTAPYLVHLDHKNPFTGWVFEKGWAQHWGIFVTSDANLKVLRKHFRQLLMVYDESNEPLYFRFYDPRVLRVYIPECNEQEIDQLYGPITSFAFEGEQPSQFIRYWPTASLPRKEALDLNTVQS